MARILHAVLIPGEGCAGPTLHLYCQHLDARGCVRAYGALGVTALLADVDPPLPAAGRERDLWGVYDDQTRTLRCGPSRCGPSRCGPSSRCGADSSPVVTLIRREQPINQGVPQFVPGPM